MSRHPPWSDNPNPSQRHVRRPVSRRSRHARAISKPTTPRHPARIASELELEELEFRLRMAIPIENYNSNAELYNSAPILGSFPGVTPRHSTPPPASRHATPIPLKMTIPIQYNSNSDDQITARHSTPFPAIPSILRGMAWNGVEWNWIWRWIVQP